MMMVMMMMMMMMVMMMMMISDGEGVVEGVMTVGEVEGNHNTAIWHLHLHHK